MTINVKISKKPVNYIDAITVLENKALKLSEKTHGSEFIWILEHKPIYTCGTSFNKKDIIDNSIEIIRTNRGGKITYHGPGQLVFYFVINLNKRKKDIRWFINTIEKTIINTLEKYNINAFNDKKNIGIWVEQNNKKKKIGAIGVKIKRWIAYHGFSLNISVDLNKYEKIKPCGLNKDVMTNLESFKKTKFINIKKNLINQFKKNLEF